MTANEIMIGDWVRRRWTCTDTGREVVKDFQVTEIRKNGETLYAWSKGGNMGRVEVLEPIPLNPEILEKNGWNYDGVYCNLTKGSLMLQYYPFEGIVREYYTHKSGEGEIIFQSSPGINYIHQLQHALRLCGIDKDIVL